MTCLDDLRGLGYEVSIASGCVKTEEDALAEAVLLAGEERVESDVQVLASQAAIDAAAMAAARGIPPAKIPATVAEVVAKITSQALEAITTARNETVAFHERALEIAKAMPTTYGVSGPGFGLYVQIDDATGEPTPESAEIVASLKDPDAHAERLFQHRLQRHAKAEEIWTNVSELRRKGYTVRGELQEDGSGLVARVRVQGQSELVADSTAKLSSAAADLPDLNEA